MSSSESGTAAGAGWLHFAGVGGSGMSALACFHVMGGGAATGSDRAFDEGRLPALRRELEDAGVVVVPQDGSFTGRGPAGTPCAGLVVSTAVEDRVPDVAAARATGVPVLHRSELLARHVAGHRSIAVSGTSGKSTVTAMIWTILQAAGRAPGLITGGALAGAGDGPGNVRAPGAGGDGPPWLVVEADESDGSLVRYRPWLGVVLNLGLDHKPTDEVLGMFRTFRENVRGPLVVGADPALAELHPGAHLFGLAGDAGPRAAAAGRGTWAEAVELGPRGSRFVIDGVDFALPHPGRYNVLNAVAAVAACREAGVTAADAAEPLARFAGVARRFQSLGSAGGVEVVDDFAHNPDKILASLAAARARLGGGRGRVLAVFQPHGFGPTRFLRHALVDAFADGLTPGDVVWLPEIFFAGGTVTRDISSADLVRDLARRGRDARFAAERAELPAGIAREARPGDLVLVMGARDPSLSAFCGEIKTALEQRRPEGI